MEISKLLENLFKKRGIKDVSELSTDERKDFDRWQAIIDGSEVTVAKIKDFCQSQVKLIESKCDGTNLLSPVQQASLHIYINLVKLIDSPEVERANLEKYLTDLINQ